MMQQPVQFGKISQPEHTFPRGTYLAWGVAQRICGPYGPVWEVSYLWGAPFPAHHSDAGVWSSLNTNKHVEISEGVAPQNDK